MTQTNNIREPVEIIEPGTARYRGTPVSLSTGAERSEGGGRFSGYNIKK